MARLILPVVGAAVGFYFGGPTGAQIGWAAGSIIAGVAFAETQKVQGPRLQDLKATISSYGAPLPYVFGHPRLGGQVIWASDKREIATTTKESGKGGPTVETTVYTYEQDVLIKLSCNEMAGGRRIWSNGKLVWSNGKDADIETIAASGLFARRVTWYPGGENQLPIPLMKRRSGSAMHLPTAIRSR